MKEYIERESLQDEIRSLSVSITGLLCGKGVLNEYMKQYRESVLRIVDEQPTADVQEVRHGRWLSAYEYAIMMGVTDENRLDDCRRDKVWKFCPFCEGTSKGGDNFCRNCGAKMDR